MTDIDTPLPTEGRYMAEVERMILALPAGSEFMAARLLNRMAADGWPPLDEPRSLGPLLLTLRRAGVIRKTGVTSTAARSHGGTASVWQRTDHTPEPKP
ncbi:hypothetical protein [Nocardia carnea]|uniref:hypothetical protein n=1 Tax=Nocardia carnea TaxID=37328 RepID=UPI0024589388|nr:hypothetical protein [Nocardia carnea]